MLTHQSLAIESADTVADGLLGAPFEHGGRGPLSYDCFGLFLSLYSGCGIELEDPIGGRLDLSKFKVFKLLFVRVDGPPQCLDVIQQKRPRPHVSIALTEGYALDTIEYACRSRVRELERFTTGIWRYRCLAG